MLEKLGMKPPKPMFLDGEEIKTIPRDPRFPNQNQTINCWQNYVDFHRCLQIKGEDYAPCAYFKKVYESLCPSAWYENWDSQREEGVFQGPH
ncbi:COX6B1 [Cordylochernes scorpioides]|nr:COX6B1 [Cordylochernes scorpioides]